MMRLLYKQRKSLLQYFLAFAVPVLLLCALLLKKGIYPFGPTSIARDDMYVQYMDFFLYWKDVLSGEAGIFHTFSQSIGTSPIGIAGYYLFSPVNFLLVFFDKPQIELFVFIATAVKVGLCGLCMGVFVKKRFGLQTPYTVMAAVAYACTQYVFGQMSNVMWLDGVYMLPLLLLAVHTFVTKGKRWPLYITVCLTVLFNWYTGYMNCLFIVFYYLYEVQALYPSWRMMSWRAEGKRLLSFLSTEALGVLLSCFAFLPVLLMQSTGRGFSEDVLEFGTNGTFFNIFRGFLLGSAFPSTAITLFCSVLVLLLFFAFWFSRTVTVKEKTASAVLLLLMVFSLFFKPLENIWCGFRFEYSYQYRFAYLAMLVVILIAVSAVGRLQGQRRALLGGAAAFIGILLLCDWKQPLDAYKLWIQIACIAVYTGCLLWWYRPLKQTSVRTKTVSVCVAAVLAVVFFAEIVVNGSNLIKGYNWLSANRETYIAGQQTLVDTLSQYDTDNYRVEQTVNRDGSVFNANDSLAYGYHGVQSYTSSYAAITADFLLAMGYSTRESPSLYYDALLPLDSFLGVKYLFSPWQPHGYEPTNVTPQNGKAVYRNPYALPLAFYTSQQADVPDGHENAFAYVNALYSAVLGREVQVFRPVAYAAESDEKGNVVLRLPDAAQSDTWLYGSFTTPMENTSVLLGGKQAVTYSNVGWGNWNNIRFIGELEEGPVTLTLEGLFVAPETIRADFCTVDRQAFADVVAEIRRVSENVRLTRFDDTCVELSVTADAANTVLLTIPYNTAWRVTVNGREVQAACWFDALMSIPVSAGENTIVLSYHARGLLPGACLSVFSLCAFVLWHVLEKKRIKE